MNLKSKVNPKFATGLAAGALVGAAVGLMFAPKPGKETRQIVGARVSEVGHKAVEYAGDLRGKLPLGRNSAGSEKSLATG